ncbi:asparagine synthase (glutamine-hydrolyzing) [Clostridium oryzae]|uniref:asparagine synthase (glutamine-hydrolyzing) n=1 Tax=Clostridium oryzae TaxID=1450648 RepID=A0A1V4IPB4_9CLOT|nr:asparagine synthase (glutamine-hydrolyzing) [Clostridium oryzae]OPJ61660.1 asparagine synthetase 3 [Clostridium oryzae]
MCGIAGIVNLKRDIIDQKNVLENMTRTLSKRGPNQHGYYYSPHGILGHRRLIVVDPAGGTQPMIKSIDGNKYVIVYNGELYNTEQVRKELKFLNYEFDSYSDTEVLLTSYIAWGSECLKHINGIFAFAIWNEKEENLFIARDPLGVKPLFYTIKNNNFIFGSELKTLLANPIVEPVIDEQGICEVLGLGPAHSEESGIFKNVFALPPAHYLNYNKYGLKVKEYWKLKAAAHTETEAETLEHVRSLLTDAIRGQLVSDVPVCTFLSGGLDSSLISAITSSEFKKQGKILNTYSITYEGNDKNFKANDFQPTSDDDWVDVISEFIGSNHHKIINDNHELFTALENAVQANDVPGMADIDSSLLLFCREISKEAVVALSGECADEIFGGYPWFTRPELRNLNTFPWSNATKERKAILSPHLSNINLEDYVNYQYKKTIDRVPYLEGESDENKASRRMFFLNIKWFMTTLLTRKDRMSMANSLEVRVPFADYRIVEYAYNIPGELKLYGGREKGLLRKAFTGILPDDILWRKKSPYPKTFSPEYTKDVVTSMNNILKDKTSPILELINREKVQDIVDTAGKSFGKPWFGQLMTGPQMIAYLIQIDTWLRKYNVNII